jgi:hypothetical protein
VARCIAYCNFGTNPKKPSLIKPVTYENAKNGRRKKC